MSARPDRGPGARTAAVRQWAVVVASSVLLLAGATACAGSDGEGDGPTSATDSSANPSEPVTPTETPSSTTDSQDSSSEGSGGRMPIGDTVEPGQAVIVSVSNVDGETSELASALVDDQAVDAFLSGTDLRLAAEVRSAVKDVEVPAGSTLFGSVVAVGCETPFMVTWEKTFDGIQASAPMPKSSIQCLVPVTSVALFLVESSV